MFLRDRYKFIKTVFDIKRIMVQYKGISVGLSKKGERK